MEQITRVVVGMDGSTNAHRAAEWAARLAQTTRAHVIAVHALGLLTPGDDGVPVPSHGLRSAIAAKLEREWCAPFTDAGVVPECVVLDGSPVSVLLKTADDQQADLIVVGSRGMGGFPELLLGSTSTQVAQHSTCPVVIVPFDA